MIFDLQNTKNQAVVPSLSAHKKKILEQLLLRFEHLNY